MHSSTRERRISSINRPVILARPGSAPGLHILFVQDFNAVPIPDQYAPLYESVNMHSNHQLFKHDVEIVRETRIDDVRLSQSLNRIDTILNLLDDSLVTCVKGGKVVSKSRNQTVTDGIEEVTADTSLWFKVDDSLNGLLEVVNVTYGGTIPRTKLGQVNVNQKDCIETVETKTCVVLGVTRSMDGYEFHLATGD